MLEPFERPLQNFVFVFNICSKSVNECWCRIFAHKNLKNWKTRRLMHVAGLAGKQTAAAFGPFVVLYE